MISSVFRRKSSHTASKHADSLVPSSGSSNKTNAIQQQPAPVATAPAQPVAVISHQEIKPPPVQELPVFSPVSSFPQTTTMRATRASEDEKQAKIDELQSQLVKALQDLERSERVRKRLVDNEAMVEVLKMQLEQTQQELEESEQQRRNMTDNENMFQTMKIQLEWTKKELAEAQKPKKDTAAARIAELEREVANLRAKLAVPTEEDEARLELERAEKEEQMQRAAAEAKKLLNQRVITKGEYDQIIRGAERAKTVL